MEIERPPVPKGRAYVLKTSSLQALLEQSGVEVAVHLVYRTPRVEGSVLEAEYWLPNPNVAYPRFYIRAGSLQAERRQEALGALQSIGLPALGRWMQSVVRLPDQSPLLGGRLHFEAHYLDARLTINSTPVML